jgi:trk system potassium uptake protein TrkA
MNVIVVGCGRLGSTLAVQLSVSGHQVTVIDASAKAFDNLPADFRGRVVEGDVLTREVLRRAEIEHADAFAAVTNSDTLNAVAAHIATETFHVQNVVVRNYDPRWHRYQEAFNFDIVSTAGWGMHRFEDLVTKSPLRLIFTDDKSKTAIYQIIVPKDWQGRYLAELLQETGTPNVTITRRSSVLQTDGNLQLKSGDVIYLTTTFEQVPLLRQRLTGVQEG